jgi:uncharacterized oxidoreductase
MQISNRTVLITGGTGGIGLGIAKAFRQAQSKVIVCGRDKKKLANVKETFSDITTISCNVGDTRQRKKLVEEVLRYFPDLDILINNAGIQRHIDLKKGYDELQSGEDEIAINFVSMVELTALFLGHLIKKTSAAVINVSSTLAFMPGLIKPIYSATKAAAHSYSLVLREQLKDTSVKVVEIVPPMVDTDLNKAGRDDLHLNYKGISITEYIPTIINGLKNGLDIIFYGDGDKVLTEPRGESESRLLKQLR